MHEYEMLKEIIGMIFVSTDKPPGGLKPGCVGLSAMNTNIPTF
jgi:hypothetical protein